MAVAMTAIICYNNKRSEATRKGNAMYNIDKTIKELNTALVAAHRARARAIADNERVTCKVIDDKGNVVFIAYAR